MRIGRGKVHRASTTGVRRGDLIPDGRLKVDDIDRLDNAAIAYTVADVALAATPPTNIALFGHWGSGKSSIYSMIEGRLKGRGTGVRVVRYDAWKYGGRDLKRNFIASVASDLGVKDKMFDGELVAGAQDTKLGLWPWLRRNYGSLGLGLVLAVVLAAIWIGVLAGAQTVVNHVGFWAAAGKLIAPSGTVFGLALAALIVGPKILEGAVVTTSTPPPSGDDEFSDRFTKLLKKAGVGGAGRLIVFVDELDRCAPDDVVATLVDLKTFLDVPHCVFIVAVDRAVVEEALSEVPQAKPVRGDEPYYASRGAFLDKIFQHQIALPPLRSRTLTLFARDLVEAQAGLWQELREADQELYELVVFALVPVHIRSPRRVKVLLNAYATNARIAQARGVDWMERATEIATLTVLQTEFPEVAADLLRVPRLLDFLRGTAPDASPEVQRIVDRYRPIREAKPTTGVPDIPDDDGENIANPSGDLLSDGSDSDQLPVATRTVYNQLFAYLTKIAAADIPDPRPDLLYLQSAGHREGLGSPALGDVIDFATDTSPDRVVAAFVAQPSTVVRTAVPLLVVEGEQTFGPGRFFAFESACRLVEELDWADVTAIAKDLAPRVLPSCADGRWPPQAIPGALRLASAAGQQSRAKALVRLVSSTSDDDLLVRVVLGAPVMEPGTLSELHEILRSGYAERPVPLHEALVRLPLADALDLWDATADAVMTALEQLEGSEPAVAAPPATANRRLSGVTAPAASAPEPTGDGRSRLRALLDIAGARADGEVLLSGIYGRAQTVTHEALREEAATLASDVLRSMVDPLRVNQHVLTGMRSAEPAEWPAWTGLLREAPSDASVASMAAELLMTVVLARVRDVDIDDLHHVAGTVQALTALTIVPGATPDSGETLAAILAEFRWGDIEVDDDEWEARRKTTIEVARLLRDVVDGEAVDRMLAADVAIPAAEAELTPDAVAVLLERIDHLEVGAARLVADDLDALQPRAGDELALARLRLRARVVCDGEALTAKELSMLDDNATSTEAFSDWLSLAPPGSDVAALVPRVSPTPASLEGWARASTDEGRTAVWIALERTSAVNSVLAAIGRHGVTSAVVEHLGAAVRSSGRQRLRDDAVTRLETTHLGSGARSSDGLRPASELVESLLQSGIVGDARLAGRVVVWAGRPAHGFQSRLRSLFDAAAQRSGSTFNKSEREKLYALGLLTKAPGLFGKGRRRR